MLHQTIEWPNKLGVDIGDAEIFRHRDKFRVFTEERVMLVPYAITKNPETALAICEQHGLLRSDLDDMEPHEAQALFASHVPTQVELRL